MLCCGGTKRSASMHKHSSSSIIRSESTTTTIPDSRSLKSSSYICEAPEKMHKFYVTPIISPSSIMPITLKNSKTCTIDKLLENNTILTTISEHLTVNELLRFRLVNKSWSKYISDVLRERIEGVVILQRGMEYYTKVMKSSIDIPIGRVFLNILDMNDPAVKNFFRVVGHSIHILILNLEGHSIPLFQRVLPFLQNMKQFTINLFNQRDKASRRNTLVHIIVEDYEDQNNNAHMKVKLFLPKLESIILSCESNWTSNDLFVLEDLLRASPNLKNLNLQKWPFLLKQDFFSSAPMENLQFLMVGYLADQDLQILAQKKLRLKSAEFHLDCDVEAESFDRFLESVSATMEYIQIDSKSNQNLAFRLHQKMPNLLNVRLTHWVGPICLDSFVGKCDTLMKLQLGNCDPCSISLKQMRSNPSVKYLAVNFGKFSSVSCKTRCEVVKNFICAFPELEAFMMRQVTDKTLGQIVNGWPKLKTLRVTSTFGLTDSGLTGIPAAELSKMTKIENKLFCGCCLPVPVVDFKPCVDSVRKEPHIGQLTNLVDFSVESEEGSHFPLTNFSLHLGVHELTKLQSLKLTCHNELGPHWCLKSIADNLPNLRNLTVMDRAISHDRYEEYEMHYLLKKLPNVKLHLAPTTIKHF